MDIDRDIDPPDEYGDPFDHYEEYSEWLMKNVYPIANGDDLVRHLESATGFDDFLREKHGH